MAMPGLPGRGGDLLHPPWPFARRRALLAALGLMVLAPGALALTADRPGALPLALLDPEQSDRFRAWMTLVVAEQFRTGPSPRWFHRDCAGLARYAVGQALRPHDARWRQANGLAGRRLPPELALRPEQAALSSGWLAVDGSQQAFVTALALVQGNSRPLGKEAAMVRPGDFLFFDQGDEQHLMIWMGKWIAYHNGQTAVTPSRDTPGSGHKASTKARNEDHGLRAVTLAELLQWKDTRWRPRDDNPNFAGFYRLAFLSR